MTVHVNLDGQSTHMNLAQFSLSKANIFSYNEALIVVTLSGLGSGPSSYLSCEISCSVFSVRLVSNTDITVTHHMIFGASGWGRRD
ncbi:hypothetical protein DPMN_031988 [Dreissena polymorpha]|uniref:Uncharacterized protein n=1 Tax=Dreissena polymorpha TaxID=45954 RepID=A0A9D4M344_DREPO|nr:hypothetical protein DPMN_031988 [Dreissena polymorpha]